MYIFGHRAMIHPRYFWLNQNVTAVYYSPYQDLFLNFEDEAEEGKKNHISSPTAEGRTGLDTTHYRSLILTVWNKKEEEEEAKSRSCRWEWKSSNGKLDLRALSLWKIPAAGEIHNLHGNAPLSSHPPPSQQLELRASTLDDNILACSAQIFKS